MDEVTVGKLDRELVENDSSSRPSDRSSPPNDDSDRFSLSFVMRPSPSSTPLRRLFGLARPLSASASRSASRSTSTSSSSSSSSWTRPVAEGVLPAYDLSLQYLRSSASSLSARAAALRSELDAERASSPTETKKRKVKRGKVVLSEKEKELQRLEEEGRYFDPEERWKWENGQRRSLPPSEMPTSDLKESSFDHSGPLLPARAILRQGALRTGRRS